MKKYFLLAIVVVALLAGAWYSERAYLGSSTPISATTTTDATIVSTSSTPDGWQVNAAPQPTPAQQTPAASANTEIASTPAPVPPAPAPNVTLVAGSSTYALYVPPNSTVLDAMQQLASTSGLIFTGKEYAGLGLMIQSINAKANADGSYWFLYVNGASSQTGASETILHPGDVVEWRYETNY